MQVITNSNGAKKAAVTDHSELHKLLQTRSVVGKNCLAGSNTSSMLMLHDMALRAVAGPHFTPTKQ